MTAIKIPRTIDEAVASLDGIGRLVTAKEWERAALIALLVGPAPGSGPGRGHKGSENRHFMTVKDLASHGVTGLRTRESVNRYRDAWFDAGLPQPTLGARVELPDLPWPPDEEHRRLDNGVRREAVENQARSDGTSPASAIRVAESPQAMAAAIKADPATAEVAARALAESRGLATEADPETEKLVNRMDKEQQAWEDSANRGTARGGEFENKAMFYIQQLHDYGHDARIPTVIAFAQGLLDLASAQDLTPEMFHE